MSAGRITVLTERRARRRAHASGRSRARRGGPRQAPEPPAQPRCAVLRTEKLLELARVARRLDLLGAPGSPRRAARGPRARPDAIVVFMMPYSGRSRRSRPQPADRTAADPQPRRLADVHRHAPALSHAPALPPGEGARGLLRHAARDAVVYVSQTNLDAARARPAGADPARSSTWSATAPTGLTRLPRRGRRTAYRGSRDRLRRRDVGLVGADRRARADGPPAATLRRLDAARLATSWCALDHRTSSPAIIGAGDPRRRSPCTPAGAGAISLTVYGNPYSTRWSREPWRAPECEEVVHGARPCSARRGGRHHQRRGPAVHHAAQAASTDPGRSHLGEDLRVPDDRPSDPRGGAAAARTGTT